MTDIIKQQEPNWAANGDIFTMAKNHQLLDLPNGIYEARYSMMSGWYLVKLADEYVFPYKVYNYEQWFIDRVIGTFNKTTKNLGILLNGYKGAGKSVTAKLICNQSNLPVIMVNEPGEGLLEFINSIPDNILVLLDEYEKTFDKTLQIKMLSMMDGAADMKGRRLFLLTTNSISINGNMISRPGRIRYIKSYRNLDRLIIESVVKDSLNNQAWFGQVMNFIKRLEIISIDLIKSIISEINLYDELPEQFIGIFNAILVPKAHKVYTLYFNDHDQVAEQISFEYTAKNQNTNFYIGQDFYINDYASKGLYVGTIRFISENLVIVENPRNMGALRKIENKKSVFAPSNFKAELYNAIPSYAFTELCENLNIDPTDEDYVESVETLKDRIKRGEFITYLLEETTGINEAFSNTPQDLHESVGNIDLIEEYDDEDEIQWDSAEENN